MAFGRSICLPSPRACIIRLLVLLLDGASEVSMRLVGAQEGPATMGDLLAAPRGIFALRRGFHASGAVLALLSLTSSAPVTDNHLQHPTAQCTCFGSEVATILHFRPDRSRMRARESECI